MRLFFYSIICSCLFTSLVYAQSTSLEKAQQAFQQGRFDQAVSYWQVALDTLSEQNKSRLEALLGLALSYKKLGFYDKTLNTLGEALAIAKDKGNRAIILSEIADIHLATHKQDKNQQKQSLQNAEEYLQEAEILARNIKKPGILAKVLNKQANRLTMLAETKRKWYKEAIKKYLESELYAKKANDLLLVAKVKANLAEATFLQQLRNFRNATIIVDRLNAALQATIKLPDSHDKSFGLIFLARIAMRTADRLKKENALKHAKLQLVAYNALQDAKQVAEQITDHLALSYAYGRLGELYYNAKRYTEAVSLTRQALFFAPETQEKGLLSELVYQWYWQLGRLFKAQKKPDEAIKMYKSAIEYLQPIRQRLVKTGYSSKRKQFSVDKKAIYSSTSSSFELLYFEQINLLLQQLNSVQTHHDEQQLKKELLYTLERYQVDELKNYFQELCLILLKEEEFETKINHFLGKMPEQTAILYPILLSKPNKQAHLLVILPSERLSLFPISASKVEIYFVVKNFHNQLKNSQDDIFLENANKLYNWLIKPIETTLINNNIKTLVVVPNETLRIIPFSAFYNGEEFLIQKYAVAITQALVLTDPNKLLRYFDRGQVFLGGVSEAVQGLEQLPCVQCELKILEEFYPKPKSNKFLNRDFNKNLFESELKSNRYKIVHVASHGQFKSNAYDSFLVTYDGQVKINSLEKLIKTESRKTSIELLTLSACEMAKGDPDAALGLAGVTVKVGVKSALANLWEVNDKASSTLSTYFYKYFQNKELTKAQALQEAQKELMKKKEFQHPFYWAPLLLIGNWR
ncbi:MAG: CHAT domain-containing protein [Candidatus Parabeggiatoa sp.]|nr:CHAT domain-containing protein [Candidatus Parabeggiatoa sp.]